MRSSELASYIWAVVGLGVLHMSEARNQTLLDHIPEVVSLRESETFTYSYDCEEGMVNWLCYYINEMEHPFIFSEVRYLPPFLQDGTTAENQECQSPDFSTFNITFTATTSMSGLLLFYANDSVCNIINSVGPRPFLFIVTAADTVQPSPTSSTTASTLSSTVQSSCDCLLQSSVTPSNLSAFTPSIDNADQGSEELLIGLTIIAFLVIVTAVVLATVLGIVCVRKYRYWHKSLEIAPDENRDPELVQVAGQSVSSGEISVEDIEDIGPI